MATKIAVPQSKNSHTRFITAGPSSGYPLPQKKEISLDNSGPWCGRFPGHGQNGRRCQNTWTNTRGGNATPGPHDPGQRGTICTPRATSPPGFPAFWTLPGAFKINKIWPVYDSMGRFAVVIPRPVQPSHIHTNAARKMCPMCRLCAPGRFTAENPARGYSCIPRVTFSFLNAPGRFLVPSRGNYTHTYTCLPCTHTGPPQLATSFLQYHGNEPFPVSNDPDTQARFP